MIVTQVEVWYRENGNDYRVYGELQAGEVTGSRDRINITTVPKVGLSPEIIEQMEAPVYDMFGIQK